MTVHITHQNITTMPHMPHARHATPRGGILRRVLARLVRDWQRRRMIHALDALDDRILRDIGIERGRIAEVVEGFDDRELRMAPVATSTAPTVAAPEVAVLKAHRKAA
jgi:uncharacterized protein YjiS (DUF1127 family)